MKDYKIILLGSQCSGKSTLIKYLQENTNFVCIDHDEEIKKRNGGTYPSDGNYVSNVLLPEIEQYILNHPRMIYSASFWGLGKDGIDNKRIDAAKNAGFKFVNLVTDMNTLCDRNQVRVGEGKDDAFHSLKWYQYVYKNMNELNQFDFSISTNEPIENTAEKLISFVSSLD